MTAQPPLLTPDQLWESGIDMATGLARRKARQEKWLNAEDLIQAALLGLWNAACHYRESRDTKFLTYAWYYIKGEIKSEAWRQSAFGFNAGRSEHQRGASLLKQVDLPYTNHPIYCQENAEIQLLEDRELLHQIISRLPTERMRMVARRYWIEGLSSKTIAHQLAVSESTVQKTHQEAFRRMTLIARDYLQE